MASASSVPPSLAERSDVHKSCKSIETLVNVLNDYCEASSSIVSAKKKLAKALRETAGMKATGEIAGNALAASAVIFEVMTDIDTKFGKIADRECDNISSEVKKWFKKLAKEEKVHDERMTSANTRIKQAGQVYEKKSKKNPREATEEHARYINLISTLGPEISQEKYNHALSVTQKHTSTTQSVAATLARLADSEWTRSCEEVRRFSPTIGSVGEWRALCEGGWAGAVPQDLPDIDSNAQENNTQVYLHPPQAQASPLVAQNSRGPPEQAPRGDQASIRPPAPPSPSRTATTTTAELFLSRRPSLSKSTSGQPTSAQFDSPPPKPTNPPPTAWQNEPLDPPKPGFAGDGSEKWTDTVGSVASLSAFPSPPTHYPVATTSGESDRPSRPLPIQPQASTSTSSASPQMLGPSLTESPRSWRNELGSSDTSAQGSTRGDQEEKEKGGEPNTFTFGKSSSPGTPGPDPRRSPTLLSRARRTSLRLPESQQGVDKSSPSSSVDEFGVNQALAYEPPKSGAKAQAQGVERKSSTTSAGSVVAAMRNRYTHNPGSSSPPPKDVPRLPLSVGDLASRYQPTDSPTSPRRQVASPVDDRERQGRTLEVASPRPTHLPKDRSPDGAYIRFPSPSTEANMEELARRRKEREEGERDEEARLIREARVEIERRTRELERDRAAYLSSVNGDGYASQRPSNLPQEPQRRYSQFDSPTPAISRARHHSTTHLVAPPSSSSTYLPNGSQSQPPSPADRGSDHADFCGCATCSANKYKTRNTPSPHDLRPPEPPINLRPEKPKGWIRRLSMPVGNAFSLDSKKSNSSLRNLPRAGEDGRMRRSFEQGGISNRSVTNLTRR